MNPFLLMPSERLEHWKLFRHSLETKPRSEQVQTVATYWAQAPITLSAVYNPDRPDLWQTCWERLYSNSWCRGSVAIGMENTLRLLDKPVTDLRLQLSIDHVLLLLVDHTYLLNYDWGSVYTLPLPNHHIMREWKFTGRAYTELVN